MNETGWDELSNREKSTELAARRWQTTALATIPKLGGKQRTATVAITTTTTLAYVQGLMLSVDFRISLLLPPSKCYVLVVDGDCLYHLWESKPVGATSWAIVKGLAVSGRVSIIL